MGEQKTLICIMNKHTAYTIVESVTEEEWKNILKEQYAKAVKSEDGLYIADPLMLEIEEIDEAINSEEEFIAYVNNLIEESDCLCWDIKN